MQTRIQGFLEEWGVDPRQVRPTFKRLLDILSSLDAHLDFIVRKGVSASLRAAHPFQALSRPLFCLVDVVEDPEGPWLSVCFYADAVPDPEDLGNLVPGGLLGEHGRCFDIEGPNETLERYVMSCILLAFDTASVGPKPDATSHLAPGLASR